MSNKQSISSKLANLIHEKKDPRALAVFLWYL